MINRILFNISAFPTRAIEFILSASAGLYGLYMLSPLYTTLLEHGYLFNNPHIVHIMGAVFVLSAIVALIGLLKDSPWVRSRGMFLLFMSLLFITIIRLLAYGFWTLSWFFPFVCVLIVSVLRIKIQLGGKVWTPQ